MPGFFARARSRSDNGDLAVLFRGLLGKQRDTGSLLLEWQFNEKGGGPPLLLGL